MTLSTLVLDALFPDACLSCLGPREWSWRHQVACNGCLAAVRLPSTFSCGTCAQQSETLDPPCHPGAPVALALGSRHARTVGALTTSLLHEGITRAASPLAELLAGTCVEAGVPLHRTFAAPVPEGRAATLERGYDAQLLLAEQVSATLRVPLASQLLTLRPSSAGQVLGIGEPGDAAGALLVILVAAHAPQARRAEQLAELVSAACPHARTLLLACCA